MNIQWAQSVVDPVPACLFENRLRFLSTNGCSTPTIMHPATLRHFDTLTIECDNLEMYRRCALYYNLYLILFAIHDRKLFKCSFFYFESLSLYFLL